MAITYDGRLTCSFGVTDLNRSIDWYREQGIEGGAARNAIAVLEQEASLFKQALLATGF